MVPAKSAAPGGPQSRPVTGVELSRPTSFAGTSWPHEIGGLRLRLSLYACRSGRPPGSASEGPTLTFAMDRRPERRSYTCLAGRDCVGGELRTPQSLRDSECSTTRTLSSHSAHSVSSRQNADWREREARCVSAAGLSIFSLPLSRMRVKSSQTRALLRDVWGDVHVEESSLRFHIKNLRKALGDTRSDTTVCHQRARSRLLLCRTGGSDRERGQASVRRRAGCREEQPSSPHNLDLRPLG